MLETVKKHLKEAESFNFYEHYVDYVFYMVDRSVQNEVNSMTTAQVNDIDYLISKLQEELSS